MIELKYMVSDAFCNKTKIFAAQVSKKWQQEKKKKSEIGSIYSEKEPGSCSKSGICNYRKDWWTWWVICFFFPLKLGLKEMTLNSNWRD